MKLPDKWKCNLYPGKTRTILYSLTNEGTTFEILTMLILQDVHKH